MPEANQEERGALIETVLNYFDSNLDFQLNPQQTSAKKNAFNVKKESDP